MERTKSPDLVARIYNHWSFPPLIGAISGASAALGAYAAKEHPAVGYVSAGLLPIIILGEGMNRMRQHAREVNGAVPSDPVRGEARAGSFFTTGVLSATAAGIYLAYLQ